MQLNSANYSRHNDRICNKKNNDKTFPPVGRFGFPGIGGVSEIYINIIISYIALLKYS